MKAEYTYNSQYLMKNGAPWFPVMGELHYTRYKETLWEESLRKMKAGGVDIVSTYIIWIHHEEEEGVFRFDGCRNLRGFLEACKKVGMEVFLRLGPWVHGEVRNGGFPDWLQRKESEGVCLRSNDERYLSFVRRYWEQVYEQVRGFLSEEGGPVIGVQIENEYGHVGGLQGEAGEAHMRTLTALAKEIGFCVPLYTATGWGGACIGDLLPVMGGYCEAPWDQSTEELAANANYVFSHVRNDALIACDHHIEGAVTFDESKFPYLTAELGGGLQVTAHRRPVATGADIGAMSLTKLGSGVAMLGYYMYHGGSNPEGTLSTLQESKATGYLNDLPEINYDFNAPIRQYGTISDSYREIKLLAYFLRDFGTDFAALSAEISPENVKPEDRHTLRLACRHDAKHGYVFFNNYQRRRTMDAHEGVVLNGWKADGAISFPAITIENGEYGFFPYGMRLGEATLLSALATPLCRLSGEGQDTWVFYGDREPQFSWKDERRAELLLLSRKEALSAWKVRLDRDYLVLSEDYVWEEDGALRVTGGADTKIRCFPEVTGGISGFVCKGKEGRFSVYERKEEPLPVSVSFAQTGNDAQKTVYELTVRYGRKLTDVDRTAGHDILLGLSYAGNSLEIFLDGRKINDHFYTGQEVLLSLGYFSFPEKLTVAVQALRETEPVFLEKLPVFTDGCACRLEAVRAEERIR